jgi:cytosine/adenosine deaminase-related metal-dependent hydrolase
MSESVPRVLEFDWLAPMDGPTLRDGAVAVIDGRFAAVGGAREIRAAYPEATVEKFAGCALVPGLVNAHVHLELSHRRAGSRPDGGFGEWVGGMIRQGMAEVDRAGEIVPASVKSGVEQCLRFGVTTVGDITGMPGLSRPVLAGGPIRVVSFGEVTGMSTRRNRLEPRLAAAADRRWDSDYLRAGISPHAPYSVEPGGYLRCLQAARAGRYRLATHLAESAGEAEFLAEHGGPLRLVWEELGGLDSAVPRFSGGPIRLAQELGLLHYPTLFAHVNYCDDTELAILASKRQSGFSIVYCPRTHAYFGHAPHRWREMLALRINVAIGTDSCASSPDLNLLDDLRLVREIAPEVAAEELWAMVTTRAAAALGWEDAIGSLSAEKWADMAAFAVSGDDPLESILDAGREPIAVWTGGVRRK